MHTWHFLILQFIAIYRNTETTIRRSYSWAVSLYFPPNVLWICTLKYYKDDNLIFLKIVTVSWQMPLMYNVTAGSFEWMKQDLNAKSNKQSQPSCEIAIKPQGASSSTTAQIFSLSFVPSASQVTPVCKPFGVGRGSHYNNKKTRCMSSHQGSLEKLVTLKTYASKCKQFCSQALYYFCIKEVKSYGKGVHSLKWPLSLWNETEMATHPSVGAYTYSNSTI